MPNFHGAKLAYGLYEMLIKQIVSIKSVATGRLCHKNFHGGESLGTTTCLKTVVRGKQGHAPCEIRLLHKAFFCVIQI